MVKWRSHHPRNDLAAKACVASVQRFVIQTAHPSRSHILASWPIEVEILASVTFTNPTRKAIVFVLQHLLPAYVRFQHRQSPKEIADQKLVEIR